MEWNFKMIIFSTLSYGILSEGNDSDWFSAQEKCRNRGKQLTTNSSASVDYYWTGKHKRYSQMMNILGCYGDNDVLNNTLQIFEMKKDASIGLCQEYCMNLNSTIYAVKNNECRCLQNSITAASRSAGNCNYRCINEEDDILSNECGGNGTFNVFTTMEAVKLEDEKHCVAIACKDATFKVRDCTDTLKVLCNSTEITTLKKIWRKSLEECKSSYGLYAIGHRNLSYLTLGCQTANSQTLWIGAVQEKYVSKDNGHKIHDKKLYFRCQKCKTGDCAYEKCSTDIKSDVFCSPVITSRQESTSTYYIDVVSATESTSGNKKNGIHFVIVPVVLGIIVIIVVVFVIVLYQKRKADCVTRATVDKETPESEEINESTLKLCQYPGKESCSLSHSNVSETNEENAVQIYTVGDENCYDNSDWKNVRKKETSGNIYDHTPCKDKSEESVYDLTTDNHMKEVLVEDTYDKVLQT